MTYLSDPKGGMAMNKWIKTILIVLVVGFCLFYLFTRPEAAAEAVKSFFGLFDSLGRFFAELAKK